MEITNVKPVFVVWSNTDLTEGRGREYPKEICISKSTALRFAAGGYVMGTDCQITESISFDLVDGDKFLGKFGPCIVHNATPEDKWNDEKIALADAKRKAKEAALLKAKAAGLTDEELMALMS